MLSLHYIHITNYSNEGYRRDVIRSSKKVKGNRWERVNSKEE
jgi:hypothetical protein